MNLKEVLYFLGVGQDLAFEDEEDSAIIAQKAGQNVVSYTL